MEDDERPEPRDGVRTRPVLKHEGFCKWPVFVKVLQMGASRRPAGTLGSDSARPASEALLSMMLLSRNPVQEADRLRASAWGSTFPVDPVQIARRLGIDVRQAPLSPSVSGALVKRLGEDPAILLNANDHPNRQRFTCAHELGHFVTREDEPDVYEYVDLRDTVFSSAGTGPDEVFANAFAANLLMPQDEVARLEEQGYTPTRMALYFGVSQDAMGFRLKNLRKLPA